MPFAETRMQPEIIIISKVSQKKTNNKWYYLFVESQVWHKGTNLQNRNRLVVSKGEGPEEGWIENLRLADTNYHIENG